MRHIMKKPILTYSLIALFLASILFWVWMFQNPQNPPAEELADSIELTMYRSEGCNCCINWAQHLEENGFRVTEQTVQDLGSVKNERGVPGELASCHTAVVDGYVVEGHVPAEDIHRMLREQPEATGIAVPGMPMGSPGMEGMTSESYQVILFDSEGNESVYAEH